MKREEQNMKDIARFSSFSFSLWLQFLSFLYSFSSENFFLSMHCTLLFETSFILSFLNSSFLFSLIHRYRVSFCNVFSCHCGAVDVFHPFQTPFFHSIIMHVYGFSAWNETLDPMKWECFVTFRLASFSCFLNFRETEIMMVVYFDCWDCWAQCSANKMKRNLFTLEYSTWSHLVLLVVDENEMRMKKRNLVLSYQCRTVNKNNDEKAFHIYSDTLRSFFYSFFLQFCFFLFFHFFFISYYWNSKHVSECIIGKKMAKEKKYNGIFLFLSSKSMKGNKK